METLLEQIQYANGGLNRLRELTDYLNEQEARELYFSRLWSDSGLGIAIVAPNGTFLHLNPDYAQLLRVPCEMAIGTRWQDYTPEPDLSRDQALVDKCLRGEIDHYVLPKRYGKQDAYSYALMRVSTVRDEYERAIYFFVTAQDLDRGDLLSKLKELDD